MAIRENKSTRNLFLNFVPNNTTHLIANLSWIGKAVDVDEIEVKTLLTNQLHAKWIADMCDEISSEKGK